MNRAQRCSRPSLQGEHSHAISGNIKGFHSWGIWARSNATTDPAFLRVHCEQAMLLLNIPDLKTQPGEPPQRHFSNLKEEKESLWHMFKTPSRKYQWLISKAKKEESRKKKKRSLSRRCRQRRRRSGCPLRRCKGSWWEHGGLSKYQLVSWKKEKGKENIWGSTEIQANLKYPLWFLTLKNVGSTCAQVCPSPRWPTRCASHKGQTSWLLS